MELDIQNNSGSAAMPVKCGTCEMLQHAPLACTDCHQLLDHVQGADYFEVFGLSRSYQVDVDELGRRYLSISRNIHPDKFATAGHEMQSFALRMSAAVNKAHEVLRDPFLRAEYLLESAGGPSASHDKRVPGSLLTEVMMLREELEEARAAGDEQTLGRLRADVAKRRDDAERRITQLCAGLENATDEPKIELRQQLNAMKYLNNLLAQL